MHPHEKIGGEGNQPRGSAKCRQTVLFFCSVWNTTRCVGHLFFTNFHHFIMQRYAITEYNMALCLCMSLRVCVSVTSQCSTKMAKCRMRQTMLHDGLWTLVFWGQRSWGKFEWVTPNGSAKCRCDGQKLANFHK